MLNIFTDPIHDKHGKTSNIFIMLITSRAVQWVQYKHKSKNQLRSPWDFGEQLSVFFPVLRSLPAVSAPSLPEWEHPERDPRRSWHPSQTQHRRTKQRPAEACFIEKSGVLQITYLTAMLHLPQDVVSRSGNWYYCGGHSAKHPRWWRGDTGQSRCAGRGMRWVLWVLDVP